MVVYYVYARWRVKGRRIQEEQHAQALALFASKNKPPCPVCGTPISYESRRYTHCSRRCSLISSNSRRPGKLNHACVDCHKVVDYGCQRCRVCSDQHRRGTLETARTDGLRKRILLEECGHRCCVCGLSEWMGKPIPIELDHVDGNSDNNTRTNLRLLCANCHAQTPTYRAKNKGRAGSRGRTRNKATSSSGRMSVFPTDNAGPIPAVVTK